MGNEKIRNYIITERSEYNSYYRNSSSYYILSGYRNIFYFLN